MSLLLGISLMLMALLHQHHIHSLEDDHINCMCKLVNQMMNKDKFQDHIMYSQYTNMDIIMNYLYNNLAHNHQGDNLKCKYTQLEHQ